MGIIVTAKYEGKIDDRHKRRIQAVFERCGIRAPPGPDFPTTEEETSEIDFSSGEWEMIPTDSFSDASWSRNEDGTENEFDIFVGDGLERANRLAAELRACGMIVVMRAGSEETDE